MLQTISENNNQFRTKHEHYEDLLLIHRKKTGCEALEFSIVRIKSTASQLHSTKY